MEIKMLLMTAVLSFSGLVSVSAQTAFPTAFPTTQFGSCSVGGVRGNCRAVSDCGGIALSGFCPGPAGIQCCLLDPVATTVTFTPPASDTSVNNGACTSPINGFQGVCIDVARCTGATFNGRCPGSSAIKCCVDEDNSVPDLLNDPAFAAATRNLFLLDFATFRSLFNGISAARAAAMFPYYNYALAEVLLDAQSSRESCFRSAAFAAQVGHESGGLKFFEELVSGAQYEGRTDLGNTQPGDGRRFKGRGPIQLTGRSNYASASTRIPFNFVSSPESVCKPSFGFLTTVDFWMNNNLNRFAGSSSQSSFITLTRRINGGTNGLTDRINRWNSARRLLGCDNLAGATFLGFEEENIGQTLGVIIAAVCSVSALAAVAYYKIKVQPKYQDDFENDNDVAVNEGKSDLLRNDGPEREGGKQRNVPGSYLESML